MGSAKHIRNNGEQINIHGHDNYQMPGAYKQMGDMNQNQPARYGAPEQPGKISGGAARYMKESYGVDKIGDPTDPEKESKSKTSTVKEIKLKDPKIPASSVTDFKKQDVRDVIKNQEQYDKNTTQVTQNLAELDSLKMVAKGQSPNAKALYGYKYNSSMPLDGKNIGDYRGSLSYGQRVNIGKLREKAKEVQGPRPTLGPNKIHSSKGYGINKILGDLDNSGDLSDYEAKRQAAIDKNMSEGSTKKGYKH